MFAFGKYFQPSLILRIRPGALSVNYSRKKFHNIGPRFDLKSFDGGQGKTAVAC